MCEYLGYQVTQLKRVRIMNVELGDLKAGQWRYLTEAEMAEINQAVAHSAKTEEASRDQNKQELTVEQTYRNKKVQQASTSGFESENNREKPNAKSVAKKQRIDLIAPAKTDKKPKARAGNKKAILSLPRSRNKG